MLNSGSGPDYHLILKKSFLETLKESYRLRCNPYPADKTWFCRVFVVFALGELYRQHAGPKRDQAVPGCGYFESAMALFEDLYEEPTIEYIETILLIVSISFIFVPFPGSPHTLIPKFRQQCCSLLGVFSPHCIKLY
jgi:hypothetical protein